MEYVVEEVWMGKQSVVVINFFNACKKLVVVLCGSVISPTLFVAMINDIFDEGPLYCAALGPVCLRTGRTCC